MTEQTGGARRLSVVVPVYNERENLPRLHRRLGDALDTLPGYEVEAIFVDDGSSDGSLEILRSLRARDQRIKVLRFSRNFGSYYAILAGVRAAQGDAVVWITSDLQDPPELITQLARRWEDGADVVWAVRTRRDDPLLRRVAAAVFYRVLRRISLPDYPLLGMDICLLDRRVADLFAALGERNRFTQGLILGLGFTQVVVPYVRERRQGGKSKWGNFERLSKLGIDTVVGTSYVPMRLMWYGGLFLAAAAALLGLALLGGRVFLRAPASPWALVGLIVVFLAGLHAIMLGILGEYLWRALDEIRGRPLYVIQDSLGFDASAWTGQDPPPREMLDRRGAGVDPRA